VVLENDGEQEEEVQLLLSYQVGQPKGKAWQN
jgi:hypothetical protein